MYRVSKEIDFCYGHRLLDYDGKCRFLHGHNGRVEIELEGESLDERAMIVDFGEIKSVMKQWIDENLDHRMILRKDDPAVAFLEDQGEPCFLVDENPTAETIARLIFEETLRRGFPVVRVVLWETPDSCATYCAP
ncbi:6-carboxytetrahydropterin synthase [Candidatus Sumerlaeota bacterium]|nr:6-carboxytetrahydropterin synthase [Candidatus Sumerlaeota bacterium]